MTINNYREQLRLTPNASSTAKSLLEKRGLSEIDFYNFLKLRSPDPEGDQEFADLHKTVETRIFSMGSSMYKYSYEYYGTIDFWWVIAWYNNRPTDSHFKIGETVEIPTDLDRAVELAVRETQEG